MRVVPIAAALWAAHALAQSPTPAAPAPAPAPAAAPAPMAPAPAPAATQPTPAPSTVATPEMAPPPVPSANPTPAPAQDPLSFGVLVDVGVPDGAGASLVFRPMNWLRLSAGGTYNYVSAGFRGGVSVVPLNLPVSPSLNVEVGHFLAGDVTPILEQAFEGSGITVPDNRLLRQVAYDYANGHLGLEVGVPRTFVFFLRAGVSYIQSKLVGFEQVVQEAASGDPNNPDTSITAQDLNIRLVAPSLKLGIVVFF